MFGLKCMEVFLTATTLYAATSGSGLLPKIGAAIILVFLFLVCAKGGRR